MNQYWSDIADTIVLGNTIQTYTIVLGMLGIFLIVCRMIFRQLFRRLEVLVKKTSTDIDDSLLEVAKRNRWLLVMVLSLIYLEALITFDHKVTVGLNVLIAVFSVLLVIRVINYGIDFLMKRMMKERNEPPEQFTIQLLGILGKVMVWIFAFLFLISSFGYDITSLIAGLGIGGIAVALAVQNILSDIISCISIYLDKPFQLGDFIVIGDKIGTVKSIGLKTTRLNSLHGEEIIISNKKLTESDIHNFGRMRQRRVVVNIGVRYRTSLKVMKEIPKILKRIVESVPDTKFEDAHFKSFDAHGKIFELVFFVTSKDHHTYLERLEQVNFGIEESFAKSKIELAYRDKE